MIQADKALCQGEHQSDSAQNESSIKLTLSPEDRNCKPQDAKRENSLLNSSNTVEITSEEFEKYVIAPHSRSWCGAVLSEKRISRNFLQIQVVALDFDNDPEKLTTKGLTLITPAQVEMRCKEEGLDISLIYTSFSDQPNQRKFRAVWILAKPVDQLSDAKKIVKQLMALFPEADDSCKDPIRMWYGGRARIGGNIHYRLSLSKLESVAAPAIAHQAKPDHLSRTIKRSFIDNRASFVQPPYNNIEGERISPIFEKPLEHYDWEYAAGECEILRKLLEAKEKLYHNDLFFLASGMFYIRGGAAKFKQAVRANPNISPEKEFIIEYIRVRSKTSDPIYPISFASLPHSHPDAHLHRQFKNLLAIRPVRQYDKPRLIKDERQLIPLDYAREQLKTELTKAIQSNDEKIYVFKCATGIGKTRLALQQKGVVILFPNHDLKDEKSREMKKPHCCTPRLPGALPPVIKSRYEQLCRIGQHTKANDYLKAIRDGEIVLNLSEQELNDCKNELKEYFNQMQQCFSTRCTVLTTHQKGIFVDFPNHSTYIIDEDILSNLLKEECICLNDLNLIANALRKKGATTDAEKLEGLALELKAQVGNIIYSFEPIVFENQPIVEETLFEIADQLNGNVTAFLKCGLCRITPKDPNDTQGELIISFIKRVELIPGKKYIILSATANEGLYRKLFPKGLEFIDLSQVEFKGQVIQFSDKSFSRSALKRNEDRLKVAENFLPNLPVITFKKLGLTIPEADQTVYYGKCEGYNHLSGKDIRIIGTPHLNVGTYLLVAKALGIELPPDAAQLRQMKVQHNGFEYYLYTFENEHLRAIQFYFIERELIQAIGRARLTDNEAVVFLFSDFPIPGAEQYYIKETEKIEQRYKEYVQKKSEKNLKSGSGKQLKLGVEPQEGG